MESIEGGKISRGNAAGGSLGDGVGDWKGETEGGEWRVESGVLPFTWVFSWWGSSTTLGSFLEIALFWPPFRHFSRHSSCLTRSRSIR